MLILNQSDWHELHQQAPVTSPDIPALDDFESLTGVPELVGCGYNRSLELCPEVWLNLSDCKYYQDCILHESVHPHLIQVMILLSGFLYFDEVYPNLGGTRSYFSGSGMSPAYVKKLRSGERLISVNIEIEPKLLEAFLLDDRQYHSDCVKQLFKREDWKISFYPTVTAKMRSLAQQLWNAPYQGAAKRMYLQAKVFELLAMHLDLLSKDVGRTQLTSSLKPDTIARLHYAKEILTTQFENAPLLSEVAKQVGVSDRTLRRGFQELFGTTVIGYLTQQRMQRAKQLLQEGQWTVTEVARTVGYGHLGHFAAAFKRQFGITPKECSIGKMPELNDAWQ